MPRNGRSQAHLFPQRSIFERASFAVNLLQRHSFWFLPRLSVRCPVIHFRCGRHDDATCATRPHETILLVSTSRSNRYSSRSRSLRQVSRPLGLSFRLYVPDSSLANQQSPMLSFLCPSAYSMLRSAKKAGNLELACSVSLLPALYLQVRDSTFALCIIIYTYLLMSIYLYI